ncbi:heterokaryon incompatibility protein-domain-containing protein [Sordaria brevicollis]|uniref:Heterokaryon incompatibility protein-domain-containing protein n=1 Tax=Sordaria brevicollis TaxID=83679 RepID=A0AAE0UDN5_SORBR|nr:heterokaryon incompatibility protein-domain-containing protein [Sordaria brevicollis]
MESVTILSDAIKAFLRYISSLWHRFLTLLPWIGTKSASNRPFPHFYRPLPPKFIRVFELEPGEYSDEIVGRLVPQAIDAEPYEAISYVWGDATKRRNITIDGVALSVTENLHGALTAFRHRPVAAGSIDEESDAGIVPVNRHSRVRRLWADAVCINQEDMKERVSQVELMSLIYAGAQRVLSWLGWEEGEEGRRHKQDAIAFIKEFMEDPQVGINEARVLLLHHDFNADPTEDLAHLSEDDRRRFREQARKWDTVKRFFEVEYFHRAWIVQELGLAREALLTTALKPVHKGKSVNESNGIDNEGQGLEISILKWPLMGRFVEVLDYSSASLVTHLGLVSWVVHHILLVWSTDENGVPDCDFLTGLHWTRILRVTDPRDRIFSLLGHPRAVLNGELVIHPDYTRTRGVIYTRLAINMIRKTKNLYVVSLVDHEDDPSVEECEWDPEQDARMPSWVPDWHSINRTTPVDYPIAAAATEDDSIEIEGGVDCEDGTSLPHLLVRGWVIDKITAVSRRMETTDFPITHLARERTKQNPFWLDRVWELVRPAKQEDALAVLESLSLALPLGTREKNDPVSTVGSNQTLEEHQKSFATYVLEYHELLRGALAEAGCDNTDGVDKSSFLPDRSVFDSLPADAQAELRRRGEGATAAGFLECMTWPSMCRVVYRTESGLVGMGSRVTRPGDLVCRVRGSAVLMTLRKVDDSNVSEMTEPTTPTETTMSIRCVHIAPTVIPARMKKGNVDGAEFGEKACDLRIM